MYLNTMLLVFLIWDFRQCIRCQEFQHTIDDSEQHSKNFNHSYVEENPTYPTNPDRIHLRHQNIEGNRDKNDAFDKNKLPLTDVQMHSKKIRQLQDGKKDDGNFDEDNYPIDDLPQHFPKLSTNDNDGDEDSTEDFLNDAPKYLPRFGQQNAGKYENINPYIKRPLKLMYTKEIALKQGRLQGIVRTMAPQTGLRDVNQFLGIPYAEAPIGSRRFMPPGAALPWDGLKIARHLPPVCPQKLPDLNVAFKTMPKGQYDQLKRLHPYLTKESEDCLYLNIYTPTEDGQKYPVIVYIHGESFEWNSGNPYDGSVLATYGQVIVVTLNYRLGVLGFLRPGTDEHIVSNFGLFDQVAALHWIKENIVAFNGDKDSVTLMGHSTGAACVNFLMVSPVAQDLFHRAILMSGSAMADWATSNQSLTSQIAHELNCPFSDSDQMLNCFRAKRYQDFLTVQTENSQFTTLVGPIVDGHVIPNQPYKVMSQSTDLFSRYDLLFGVTEVESYHLLNEIQLQEGLREQERDNLLDIYMRNRFEIRPDLAKASVLKRYTEVYNNPKMATNQEHRDAVLDILSDARVVAPIIQTGLYHAEVNPRNFMYVFGHNSAAGPHKHLPESIEGEELAFVFGNPLAHAGPFHDRYNASEKLLSEAVMSYWTNFAKTGNPKAPWKGTFINSHAMEWALYDIDWPEFNRKSQAFVNIGIPPSIGQKYRDIYMDFWNKELPDEINHIGKIQTSPYNHFYPFGPTQIPRGGTSVLPAEMITGHMSKYGPRKSSRPTDDPVRTLKLLLQEPIPVQEETVDSMYNAPPTFGVVHTGAQTESPARDLVPASVTTLYHDENQIARSESTIHLLIGLLVLFLVLNLIIYTAFVLQKKKKGTNVNRKLGILSYDGTTDDELKRSKNNDGDDSYILDIVRKSSTFDAIKTNHSPINGFKITRQLSSSTLDAHAKVCDWMSHDISKGSPRSSKKSSPSFTLPGRSFLRRPRKVNVGIDATPHARSNSILRQEPIEVTKLKSVECPRNIIICQEVDITNDIQLDENSINGKSNRFNGGSKSSIQECGPIETIKIDHKHSRSDPVDMYYTIHKNDEKVTSFVNDDLDINVTSRDQNFDIKDPLTHEQQMQTIKRRNFPKVLPNYPCDNRQQYQQQQQQYDNSSFKRNSLPANSFIQTQLGRMAPMPPPRTISTLGRRTSAHRHSNNITTSPLMLAQDCTEEDEPEITQNTLIVGPIIPKNLENNYSTIRRNKSNELQHQHQQPNKNQNQNPNQTQNQNQNQPTEIEQRMIVPIANEMSQANKNMLPLDSVTGTPIVSSNELFPKQIKPSGIRPPAINTNTLTSSFQSKPLMSPVDHHQQQQLQKQQQQQPISQLEPNIVIKQNPITNKQLSGTISKSNIPRVHTIGMNSNYEVPQSILPNPNPYHHQQHQNLQQQYQHHPNHHYSHHISSTNNSNGSSSIPISFRLPPPHQQQHQQHQQQQHQPQQDEQQQQKTHQQQQHQNIVIPCNPAGVCYVPSSSSTATSSSSSSSSSSTSSTSFSDKDKIPTEEPSSSSSSSGATTSSSSTGTVRTELKKN